MNRTIIVSDLHVDTWTDRRIGDSGKTRRDLFFEFLAACKQAEVRELVLNGDLMDFPPYEGQFSFPEGPCIARDVVERLVQFAAEVPVTYVFGNHDIGISGFRSMGERSIAALRNVNFCYPNYVINDYPGSTILVEHGHFCDPALILYLRDLANRTYVESRFDAFNWAMQRRPEIRPGQPRPLGVFAPPSVTPGENAFRAAKEGQKPLPPASASTLWSRIWQWITRASAKPTMEHWWREAIEEGKRYLERHQSQETKPVLYQIYGHTHRADPRDAVPLGKTSFLYINSGTWTEDADQGWYLDIDPTGKAWLQDWINEPASLKRLP